MNPGQALTAIPAGLRTPLLDEYRSILQNYMEHRWAPASLGAGRFCEIVYSILDGHASGTYAASPQKPPDFVAACRKLESNTHVPRSFRILIPRLLPALYEVRNNRGVGHVGGDVDPNPMDSTALVAMCNWIMAELVRVLHQLPSDQAQRLVDALSERRIPLVWQGTEARRVLDPKLPLRDQILLLISSMPTPVQAEDLFNWTGSKKRPYFIRLLRKLHETRLAELSKNETIIEILPPGQQLVSQLLAKRGLL